MFRTPGATAFMAAWQGLCKTTTTPHFRTAFQELSADIIPRLMILEEAPGGKFVVRFMGTSRAEMWGQELTGKDTIALMPSTAAAARGNLATMLQHPCGMHHIAQYISPTGRELEMENITVPVGNDPGLPRRVMNFTDELSTIAYGAPLGEVRSVSKRAWLDVGAGVPDNAPLK